MDTPFIPRTALPRPLAMVDTVVLTLVHGRLSVALTQRAHAPFEGMWALPGGVIRPDEDSDTQHAAQRILAAKLGPSRFHMEQLATFSGPQRDPDGWSLSVVYLVVVPLSALSDMKPDVVLHPVDDLPDMGFDHAHIVETAVARMRGKGAYSTLPAALLEETFTLSALQKAYEAVAGKRIDTSSFRRKIRELDLITETGDTAGDGRGRPAAVYTLAARIGAFNRTLAA
jgi:ADP-ribose pyrophosphatase YjhB (NUDIX family)